MIATLSPQEIARERAPQLLSREAGRSLVDEAISIMSEIRPAGYRAAALAVAEADEREGLKAVAVPTLLIWGEQDRITPLPEGQAIREAIPGSQLHVIRNAGHLSYLEQPDDFNRIVRGFCSGRLTTPALRATPPETGGELL